MSFLHCRDVNLHTTTHQPIQICQNIPTQFQPNFEHINHVYNMIFRFDTKSLLNIYR